MFGCDEKVGLRTTKNPAEIVDTISTIRKQADE